MLMNLLRELAGRLRRIGRALHASLLRSRRRTAARAMLRLDERLLWDIGLTRADVVDCLSSPADDVAEFLEARRRMNLAPRRSEPVSIPARDAERLAA